jgi:hypothetical protein
MRGQKAHGQRTPGRLGENKRGFSSSFFGLGRERASVRQTPLRTPNQMLACASTKHATEGILRRTVA